MRKTITAVVPVREGSQRVKNKNFKPFGDTNLLELKLQTLLQVKTLDNIIVTTDSEQAKKIANSYGVDVHEREKYYASSKCTNSEFFENLGQNIHGDYLMYTPVTSPFIKVKTYYDFINRFSNSTCDSMVTASYIKHHMWLNNKPINYDPQVAPNTQDLPDILGLTYGVNLLSRENMIKFKNVVGNNPSFYVVEGKEAIDIDNPLDFEFAEFLYKK
jgi:CMP-N-acetylneuraminic acid synthetase|tara:strand:+ start:5490 stop:6137 length:648 start_codon:yes stop_codon:yes gene_type:complete